MLPYNTIIGKQRLRKKILTLRRTQAGFHTARSMQIAASSVAPRKAPRGVDSVEQSLRLRMEASNDEPSVAVPCCAMSICFCAMFACERYCLMGTWQQKQPCSLPQRAAYPPRTFPCFTVLLTPNSLRTVQIVTQQGIHTKLRQRNERMVIRRHVGIIAVGLALCFAITILSSTTARCAEQQAELATSELTCEYATNPLGVDTPRPRFGWLLKSEQRAQLQSAYRVQVATSEKQLQANVGDKWDSGKVNSEQSVNVGYQGMALTSGEKCYWKVRVWNKAGKASKWWPWGRSTTSSQAAG